MMIGTATGVSTRSLPKGASVLNVGALVQYRTGNVQLMVEEMDGY